MNIKALITTLILGTSSVAMAKPVFSAEASVSFGYNSNTRTAPVVRDHRYQPPVADDDCNHAPAQPVVIVRQPSRPFVFEPHNTQVGAKASTYVGQKPYLSSANEPWGRRTRWMALTEPTRIDSNRMFINIGADAGRFSQLKLFNNMGRSHINQVAIELWNDDGTLTTQVVRLDRDLTSNSEITMDLVGRGRLINRVIVYGTTDRNSGFQLLAK